MRGLLTNTPVLGFFADIWNYIRNHILYSDPGNYENFDLGSGKMISFKAIIVGICIGIVVASFASAFDRKKFGGLVRKIISDECYTPETAKTLAELGFDGSMAIKRDLRSGRKLKRYVKCVEEEAFFANIPDSPTKYKQKYKHNFETDRFYIVEDEKYAADIKFELKGSGYGAVFFVTIIAIIICIVAITLLPEMLQLADNFIGIMSGDK